MKSKFGLMWRILVALVLIASFGFAAAIPAGAQSVTVTIIECPTCPVPVSTEFGVKAVVENTGSSAVGPVTVTCGVSGNAEVRDPASINIGMLDPDETDKVAFTVHCTDIGSAQVTISTNHGGEDYCNVDQADPPALETGVEGPCQICTACGQDQFQLNAWVKNTGDMPAANVRLVITRDPTSGAHIQGSTERWIGDVPANSGKIYIDTPWTGICDAEGDVTFTVTPSGENACTAEPIAGITAGTWTVHQEDVLVDVICVMGLDSTGEPACGESCGDPNTHEGDVISTLQQVAITASVHNCINTPKDLDIQLVPPTGTILVGTTAYVELAGYGVDMPVTTPDWTVDVDDVCACCEVLVTWTLQCDSACSSEYITINVTEEDTGSGTWTNFPGTCDYAWIQQVTKAHLTGDLEAYVEGCTTSTLKLSDTSSTKPAAVAVGQEFDVAIMVTNPGQAMAEDVTVDLRVENQTDCVGTFNDIDFGDIMGGYSTSLWLSDIANQGEWCECLGEGIVCVTILDIDGIDENTCEPVLTDNIDVPCPLIIEQCSFSIELMNPQTCDHICVGDAFAVKAKLTNCGPCDFHNVKFTLNHSGAGNIALAAEEPGWEKTKTEILANPCPGECNEYEVTWNVVCTGEGDEDIWVCAESAQNGTTGDLHMMVKTEKAQVHQKIPPDISIEIVSPDNMNTFVATGQEFAVTAVITNNVDTDVTVSPDLWWMPEEHASLVGGPSEFIIGPYCEETVTWTLECEDEGVLIINAYASGITHECCPTDCTMGSPIILWQYPAAHLDIEIIGVDPDTTVSVCDEFTVHYKVVNTGQADATEVNAMLSVIPEGSARPVEGIDSGYNQEIGTLTGHGQDGQGELGEYIGHWNLHCKEACESTIEITAEGFDEYGWHKKQQSHATGNFIVEYGALVSEQLDNPYYEQYGYALPPNNRGWSYGLFAGDINGLPPGPFIIDTDLSMAKLGGGPDYLGHIVGMGFVIPDMEYTGYFEYLIEETCDYGDLDLEGKDFMLWVVHIEMDSPYDMIGPWSEWCVGPGLIEVVNGTIAGTWYKWNESLGDYQDSLLGGTYHTNMAAEPGRAIPDEFIEPASVTVKQVAPSADLGVTKSASGEEIYVGETVTFTVTVTNHGPSATTGVRVTDMLPSGVNYSCHSATEGWYDVTSGTWHVGDLAMYGSEILYITATVNRVGDIFNIATVPPSDLPDSTTSNNSDMATFTGMEPEPVDMWPIELDEGYNLVSLPLYIPFDERDINDVLAGVVDNLDVTYAYDACADPGLEWSNFRPAGPPGELVEMRDGPGYWLIMTGPDTLDVSGLVLPLAPETPPTYQVCEGWNLIGFKSTVPKTPGVYLAAIDGKYTIIYGFANGRYFQAGVKDGGHEYFEPGLGYWIALKEAGEIYP